MVTVLYPGGFKPAHEGHLDLIRRYSKHPEVNEVWVLVGPGIREGISQSVAVQILEKLTEGLSNVIVQAVPWPSPVLASYKIVESADPRSYSLAASSKEAENAKRIKDFVFKHSPEGKFFRPEVNVLELPVDITPTIYEGRTDDHNKEPISASLIRQDLINGDLDNFITAYPNCSEEQISFIWDLLEQNIILPEVDEALHTSGTPTESSPLGYDRYQAGYNYKAQFPILEDDEEEDEEPLKDWTWDGERWTRRKR